MLISPGETWSFWESIGFTNEQRGYVNGMLLKNGQVMEGIGGGLCQLSNLLHWMALHSPLTIIERYHHSVDAFPDSHRTLPFASGATVFYNYLDLQVYNPTDHTVQLYLWLTDTQLKGELRSTSILGCKYHILEREHCFVRSGSGQIYRYNQLYRQCITAGILQSESMLFDTLAPVAYEISLKTLRNKGYDVYDFCEND
jgi:vancomycin resistance protein VanW